MKFIRSLLINCLIAAALVHFGGNFLMSRIFEAWLGVPVSVSYVRWGFSSHHLVIKNMRIHNPSGYREKDLAKLSTIQADYDISNIRHGMFKITRLEAMIDEVKLEKKSTGGANLMDLTPLRSLISPSDTHAKKSSSISFQIDKVSLKLGKVIFQTQLGNDQVTENRKMEYPAKDLNILTTPDSVAIYAAGLVLQSAGWQSLLPTREAATQQIQTQMNDWIEELKKKAQAAQIQLTQMINEKMKQKG